MFVEIKRGNGIPLQLAEGNVGFSLDLAFFRNNGDVEFVTVDVNLRGKRRSRRSCCWAAIATAAVPAQ